MGTSRSSHARRRQAKLKNSAPSRWIPMVGISPPSQSTTSMERMVERKEGRTAHQLMLGRMMIWAAVNWNLSIRHPVRHIQRTSNQVQPKAGEQQHKLQQCA